MSVAASPRPRLLKLARRSVTIPLVLTGFALVAPTLPLLLGVTLGVDALRRQRLNTTRLALFLALYLACGTAGILSSLGLWVAERLWPGHRGERADAAQHALQAWWARSLFGGAVRIFSLRVEIEVEPDLRHRPVLVFIRHASIVDVLLPAMLLSNQRGYRLRYVLKRELLWEPCIDLNGNRLPNYFVWRSAPDSRPEIDAVRRLGRGLGEGEGVLIYPEGTRFTPAKRARILERLEKSGDAEQLAHARALQRVLPLKLGGPLALLEESPEADAVFFGHEGLEGLTTLRDVWRGGLIGRRIRTHLWVVERDAVPVAREERVRWLHAEWSRMDAWVREEG